MYKLLVLLLLIGCSHKLAPDYNEAHITHYKGMPSFHTHTDSLFIDSLEDAARKQIKKIDSVHKKQYIKT